MTGTRPSRWSVALGLIGLALLLVVLHFGYVYAWWVYPDLTQEQRARSFDDALVSWIRVPARLDRGGTAQLARSDIAQAGPSHCVRRSNCDTLMIGGRRSGVGCRYVSVRFDCIYAVTTTDGGAAAAFVTLSSNRNYSVGVSAPGSPKPLEVDHPSFRSEYDALCRLGFNCKPATGAPPPASARSVPEPPPPAPDPAHCDGVRAEIVGEAARCLDPGDPARRAFRDCRDGFCGPAMTALPKGRGLRGSSAAEIARGHKDEPRADPGSYKSETPQREVTIGYQLAVGTFEVTFDEWEACLTDSACKRRPRDPSHPSRGARPVVHVSWNEISDEFLPWLNGRLGLSGAGAYRLPTEAEWEYAARAGTATRYAFGDIISTAEARVFDTHSVEVGSFPPNAFGLHDMHGNVAEWVQDCWDGDYSRAPVDGSAHQPERCSSRMHRGGSWNDPPRFLRSAHRGYGDPKDGNWKGFRVARTLAVR